MRKYISSLCMLDSPFYYNHVLCLMVNQKWLLEVMEFGLPLRSEGTSGALCSNLGPAYTSSLKSLGLNFFKTWAFWFCPQSLWISDGSGGTFLRSSSSGSVLQSPVVGSGAALSSLPPPAPTDWLEEMSQLVPTSQYLLFLGICWLEQLSICISNRRNLPARLVIIAKWSPKFGTIYDWWFARLFWWLISSIILSTQKSTAWACFCGCCKNSSRSWQPGQTIKYRCQFAFNIHSY